MAVLGGSVIVLMVGLLRSRFAREALVPLLTVATLLTAIGLSVWIWEPGDSEPIIEGALAVDPLALGISVLVYIAGIAAVLLSLRARGRARGRARASTSRCCSARSPGWWCWPRPRA